MNIPSLPLKDGRAVPMLGLGTGTAWYKDGGKGPVDNDLIGLLKEAIQLGWRHIDCADAYGTEQEVGMAVRESGIARADFFITTKVQDNVRNIPEAIDASLHALGLDYVDLYLIHNPWWAKSNQELQDAWTSMEAVQTAGKSKSIGVSNYLRPHIEATLATAVIPPVVNQLEFQPYLQRANHFVPWMQQRGIEVEAFKGLCPLTKGKGGPLDRPLEQMAQRHKVASSAILLRWHMQQNVVAITTTRTRERLAEYMKALDFALSPEEMEEIMQIGLSHHFRAGYQKRFAPDDGS